MARKRRGRTKVLAVAAAGLACAGLAIALPRTTRASTPQPNPYLAQGIPLVKAAKTPQGKIAASLRRAHGPRTVFVQLSGVGAVTVSDRTLRATAGSKAHRQAQARSAARARLATVRQTATSVTQAARAQDPSARELYQVGNAIPGLALRVNASALMALARRPDVVAITPITPQKMADASTIQLTNVVQSWDNTHEYGAGVTVGLIDTGIDFTHADFGGTGTSAAYNTAEADPTDPNWLTDLPALAQAKIIGGHDFVGDAYNASSPNPSINTPVADPDPLDCNGHGTEVASALAGYGVNSDGSTFTGDYSSLGSNDLYNMPVAPGTAPEAQLYVEKVFGCSGTTDAVIAALNWAMDPNQDGNFSDHLDIVNLSLEADFTTPDDPEAETIGVLAANGVLTVAAAGNGGDQTDAGGAPGNAVPALDVASSVDSYDLHDGLDVTAPSNLVGEADGQNSQDYELTSPISGNVVELSSDDPNQDGCQSYTNADGMLVSGKIVWIPWNDDPNLRDCDSTTVATNASAAGAIGVLLTSTATRFPTTITGSAALPMFQLTLQSTNTLQSAATAGTLAVTFDPSLAHTIQDQNPAYTDTLSSFSARGSHGSIGVVKPDVAAPGDTIASAAMGTGGGVTVVSGTSFAAPLVAGIAALVEEVNPGWSPAQVKAAIMNTADNSVYENTGQTGPHGLTFSPPIYGPNRVGSGRVDALGAVDTTLLAYDSAVPAGVSSSFGVVEAPITKTTMTLKRTVTVVSTAAPPASASVAYVPIITQPGVSYTSSPSTLTASDFGGATPPTVTITMHITPSALRHTIDPTEATTQDGAARQYVSDASGLLEVTPAGGAPVLRVPVYGAAKPTSTITASAGSLGGNDGVKLTGTGFNELSAGSTGYTSLVSIMTLGATSAPVPACTDSSTSGCTTNQTATGGDIQDVGAGSSPGPDGKLTDGYAYFGIATYGDVASLGRIITPTIDIYLGNDCAPVVNGACTGSPDFSLTITDLSGTDVLYAALTDLQAGPNHNVIVDWEPVNFNFGNLDTNVFDSDVAIAPVSMSALGVTSGQISFPLTYTVSETSLYGNPADGGLIDSVGPVSYDALNPGVAVKIAAGNQPLFLDSGNTLIDANATKANQSALVFNLDNASGNRAQTVAMPFSPPGAPTEVVATGQVGGIAVSWQPPSTDGGSPVTGYTIQYKPTTSSTWLSHSVSASTRSYQIPGLTSTKVYNVKVGAINNAGNKYANAAPSSLRPAADRSAATISTSASTIRYGGSATISGHFADSTTNTPLTGVTATLYGRVGNGSFTKRATRTTGTGGNASVAVSPTGSTTYYWRYAGVTGVHQAISSAQLTVTVTQVVHVVSTRNRAAAGSTVELYGTLAPNLAGEAVRVQRLTASGWRLVRAVTTRRQPLPDGRTAIGYRTAVRLAGSGPARYRVAWPATVGDRAAGVSVIRTITVT